MTVEALTGKGHRHGQDLHNSESPGLRADARRNRERILHVARQHFATHGVSTSLEEIAREASVGTGTLYRHFPSREALLAASLQDSQQQLLGHAEKARQISNPDAALAAWLDALQTYLRTFNGLPEPVLSALKEQASPLSLTCEKLASITGQFLSRAQREGTARASVTANDLFLGAIAIAWVHHRAEACGNATTGLDAILRHGYLDEDG